MPNWVYGRYAIKGPIENILAFLNEGIMNSGYKPKRDCKAAYEFLVKNAKTKESVFIYNDENDVGTKPDNPAEIVLKQRLSLDTFRPMPDTFKMYDTTNCSNNLLEIAKEQKKLYGVVGWYDWGVKYRGVKWNADMTDVDFSADDKGGAIFRFDLQTAWSYPDAWLRWVRETFCVCVLLCVSEESDSCNFYGALDGEKNDMEELDGKPNEEDFENEDEYWDALYDWQNECKDSMRGDFNDFVENY